MKILYIANYQFPVTFSVFAVLVYKLWPEKDHNPHTNHLLYSFKFIQSKAQN